LINTRFPKSNIYNKWMILITRPVSQTKNLELLLNNRNIDYALFPAFEIIKIQTAVSVKKYDIIIFISVNAVVYAEEHFDELFSDSSKVFAVGPATANQLLKNNIAVDSFPKKNASSQELLKIKECAELSNRKILIVRGKGGSETLKNHLSASNKVDYLEVYERIPCKLSKIHKESLMSFVNHPNGVSMATSEESLVNIMQLFSSASPDYLEILKSRRMIVFSERIKFTAEKLGLKKIEVTLNPSDEDFVDILFDKKL
jgi:uroporphyrinogen-III synthase